MIYMGDYKFSEQEAIANLIDELKDIYFNNKDKIDKAYEDFLKEGDDIHEHLKESPSVYKNSDILRRENNEH